MSFSLSGSSVIQTCTDANLSGMVGIGGVTLEGNTYILNGRRLVVSGDLTMNGWTEKIQFKNSPTDTINNSAPPTSEMRSSLIKVILKDQTNNLHLLAAAQYK